MVLDVTIASNHPISMNQAPMIIGIQQVPSKLEVRSLIQGREGSNAQPSFFQRSANLLSYAKYP